MPAIQLSRLNKQTDRLATLFNQPARFVRELRDLFEFYADRTRRPAQSGAPDPLIPTFNVPDPMLRRVLFAITKHIDEDPESALLLADACWGEPHLEFRILAARILGLLPIDSIGNVIERMDEWTVENPEPVLGAVLANQSLAQMRLGAQKQLTEMIERWLESDQKRLQILGLQALAELLDEPTFENLPRIYRILTHGLAQGSPVIRPYLLDVIKKLAHRSPVETAHYLREILENSPGRTPRWVIRYAADAFPDAQAQSLRKALRP